MRDEGWGGGGAGCGGAGGLGRRDVGEGGRGWRGMNDAPAAPYWAGMPAYTQLSWVLRSAGQALAWWPVVPGRSPLPQRAQALGTFAPLASVGIRVSRPSAEDRKYGSRGAFAPLPLPRPAPLVSGLPRPSLPVGGAGCWVTAVCVGACEEARLASPFSLVSSARLMAFRTYSAASEAIVQSALVVGSVRPSRMRRLSAISWRGRVAGSTAARSLAWQNLTSSVAWQAWKCATLARDVAGHKEVVAMPMSVSSRSWAGTHWRAARVGQVGLRASR